MSLAQVESLSPPEVLIESQGQPLGLNLAEMWRYRELLYFLTWRDINVRV
jgi:hypothetical protein